MTSDSGRPTSSLIDQFESIPTATLSDITRSKNIIMDTGIKPIWAIPRTAGRAVTVSIPPDDNYGVHESLTVCEQGDILVINADGYTKSAVWGEITSTVSLEKGIKGTVIDGATRDVDEVEKLAYPVCAREVNPTTTHKRIPGKINDLIQCGGISVAPNDIVVCDRDGVAIVPQVEAKSLLTKAKEKLKQEEEIISQIQNGKSTFELFGLDSRDTTVDY